MSSTLHGVLTSPTWLSSVDSDLGYGSQINHLLPKLLWPWHFITATETLRHLLKSALVLECLGGPRPGQSAACLR